MTGKTHRVGGMLCALGGYVLLQSNGLLLRNVNPLVQLAIIYPFALYGSVVSDLDHHANSIPCRDIISLFINRVFHLTSGIRGTMPDKSVGSKLLSVFDAKHRSWQTHSDLFLICLIVLAVSFMRNDYTSVNSSIVLLIFTGLVLGIISHLILDMLTPEGIWCIASTLLGRLLDNKVLPRKISFVPDTKFFRTGGPWEFIVYRVLWLICIIIFLSILLDMSPFTLSFFKG